jgi:hypothetical protein
VATGKGVFKAVRGEYGSGKTFLLRWLGERARRARFAVAEVQVSESETPLYKMETVYRRAIEHLSTEGTTTAALANIVGAWFFQLEDDVLATRLVDEDDPAAMAAAVNQLMEQRLGEVAAASPMFAAGLRGYHKALATGDHATAQGLLAWLGAQPNVGASIRRFAGLKGEIDSDGAANALRGLLRILRDSGHAGLVLVLDEVETLQRMRSDTREKSLNALRQLLDELDAERYPGLYLVVSGTPAFFDGHMGVQRLPPLAQRLATDFSTDERFDNPLAVQVRLRGFNQEGLVLLGRKVRDLFADGSTAGDRVRARCDDAYIDLLAQRVAGAFGGKSRVAPRVFLKMLVADVLQRIELFSEFDPREHYPATVNTAELTAPERAAAGVDDIELELPDDDD